MDVVTTRSDLAEARDTVTGTVGFVPTMGALHEGHLTLVRRAKQECDAVVVSIFVNPTQFGPNEDFSIYPRDLPRDVDLLAAAGADLLWAPTINDIYPRNFSTRIVVDKVTDVLEGAVRPGHFAGVATVVAVLFGAVRPTRAYFGQKDAQQSVVIKRMVADLCLPLEVVVCPTVREPDGLAMSSRNAYLNRGERAAAPVLNRALHLLEQSYLAGTVDADVLRGIAQSALATEPLARVDYVSVADPDLLAELSTVDPGRGALASLAVRVGKIRLIDNVILAPR
ncbi:MAG: pantoate--beta-alanine ligase [Micropruina sp.]